jgi:RNA polymerase sigma-70 factor (ECF subfamily)
MPEIGNSSLLQQCLDRIRSGDSSACDELLRHSQDRLKALTRRMLHHFPGVHRWEATDDVFQNVLIRLDRTLRDVPMQTVLDYVRLAACHIRHELIDLARHYYGRYGHGTHHATPRDALAACDAGAVDPAGNSSDDPARTLDWAAWHEHIGQLPDEQREVFDLLWYHGLTQPDAAEILGVSLSTVQRRWQTARVRIMEAFEGVAPD